MTKKRKPGGFKVILLVFSLILLLILFCISLFKNIGYPLLWADEGETAMFGQQVLEYGYPKVHGEKNIVYTMARGDKSLGIKEENDVFIAVGPAQFYFAALGLRWAERTEDIYAKTTRLRIPFALIGLAGVGLIGWTIAGFFQSKVAKLIYLNLFFFFELLSIPLVLHLRQVRYYPMVIFLLGAIVFTYFRYRYHSKWSWWLYTPVIVILFLLLVTTYYPVFLIMGLVIGLNEVREFWQGRGKKRWNKAVMTLSPLLLTLVLAAPFLIYFDVGQLSGDLSDGGFLNFDKLGENLSLAWSFFRYQAYGYLIIVVWGFLYFLWANSKNDSLKQNLKSRRSAAEALGLLAIVYWLILSRVPHLFERYFIVLHPLLIGVLLLNASIVWRLIQGTETAGERKNIKLVFLSLLAVVFIFNSQKIPKLIGDYAHELTHQVKGPLDYAVAYIRENYQRPEDLVVATNYEDASLMYYLGSRVVIGYAGANLEEDLKLEPDVVLIRQVWEGADFTPPPEKIRSYLEKTEYEAITFPVLDFFVNNMPESQIHVFKTVELNDNPRQLEIFVKKINI
ncbi:hypothetical protein ACFL0Y_02805 [Patescibacteria group bacterium]